MVQSQGLTVPQGFSARHLFERISNTVKPVLAMIRAVELIKKAGEMMDVIFGGSFSLFVPGFKTGVITNNWIDDTSGQRNQLMNQFLSQHFDVVMQSCQLGIRKPNPLIYRLACQRLGITPSEVGYTVAITTMTRPNVFVV